MYNKIAPDGNWTGISYFGNLFFDDNAITNMATEAEWERNNMVQHTME